MLRRAGIGVTQVKSPGDLPIRREWHSLLLTPAGLLMEGLNPDCWMGGLLPKTPRGQVTTK